MGISEILKVLVVVITIVAFLPMATQNILTFKDGTLGGFDTTKEKTASNTDTVIIPTTVRKTMDDLALSLLILDEYHPDPQVIRFTWVDKATGSVRSASDITIDDNFFNDKSEKVIEAVQAAAGPLSANHYIEWDYFTNKEGVTRWDVKIYD